jgi:hypothetical protein
MKYAITGHTSGLGKTLSNLVDFVGFSRSNGYDISSKDSRKEIINKSDDCQVFVNNAHCEFFQTTLFYELYEKWKDKNKLIINIGSNSSDGIKTYPHIYAVQKSALEKASEQLFNQSKTCQIILIKFGWINTDRVMSAFNPPSFIDVNDAAKIIVDFSLFKYKIQTVTILPN